MIKTFQPSWIKSQLYNIPIAAIRTNKAVFVRAIIFIQVVNVLSNIAHHQNELKNNIFSLKSHQEIFIIINLKRVKTSIRI